MSDPFIGEIRMFGGNFAPAGWAFCNGQLLSIAENDALFTLIGTTYGGDGQNTFALPDLRSRIPLHQGNGHVIGEMGGSEAVTLTVNQLPSHSHVPQASNAGASTSPGGNVWANSAALQFAPSNSSLQPMNPNVLGTAGGSQPHDNMLPFQAVSFIISLFGIYPSQS
jgi:microcystin-dependent protein